MNKYSHHESMSESNQLIFNDFKSFLDSGTLNMGNNLMISLLNLSKKLLLEIRLSIQEYKVLFDFLLLVNSKQSKVFLDIFSKINQKHCLSKYKVDILNNLNFKIDKGEIIGINNDTYIGLENGIGLIMENILENDNFIIILRDGNEYIVDKSGILLFGGNNVSNIKHLYGKFYICIIDNKSVIIDSQGNREFPEFSNDMDTVGILVSDNNLYQIVGEKNSNYNCELDSFTILDKNGKVCFGGKFDKIEGITADFESEEYVYGIKDNFMSYYDSGGNKSFFKEGFTVMQIGFIKNNFLTHTLVYGINSDFSPCLINKDGFSYFTGQPGLELGKGFYKDIDGNIYLGYVNSYQDISYFDINGNKGPAYGNYEFIPFDE